MRHRAIILLAVATTLFTHQLAQAGCGCDKPPPPPAPIRPNVAYPGAPITLFGDFVEGATYSVTFTSGITGGAQVASGVAATRRDLADRGMKRQIEVPLPSMPLGPVAVSVTAAGATAPMLSISDDNLTATAAPLPVPNALGKWELPGVQAAVGRDGVVHLALDLTNMREPMVVTAQMLGYALRFIDDDVTFHNRQGFLMQRLVQTNNKGKKLPVPGMFVLPTDPTSPNSDKLRYSRHEFVTYFLQHDERRPHAVDGNDGNWHLDGTPHIDHDHLILSVAGRLPDGTLPRTGATPAFDVDLTTHSLFHSGVTGADSAEIQGTSIVDSYDSDTMARGSAAMISSANTAKVRDSALVKGDVIAPIVKFENNGMATGLAAAPVAVGSLLAVKAPSGLTNLGDVDVQIGIRTITGPGSIEVKKLKASKTGRIFVDNSAGPVTIYAGDEVKIEDMAAIDVADPRPERFAIYATTNKPITFQDASRVSGAVYAPLSTITVSHDADFSGALVGKTVVAKDRSRVHYDSTLRGSDDVTTCMHTMLKSPVGGKDFDVKIHCVNDENIAVSFLATSIHSANASCTLIESDPKEIHPLSSDDFNVKVRCNAVAVPFTLIIEGVS
jgi:hypothetical protein